MPYNKTDYPVSMKNLGPLVRLKAIDILNAMLNEGYKDEDAIPISIAEAKKWVDDASKKEKSEIQKKDITKHNKVSSNKPARLMDADVNVYYDHDNKKWATKSVGAKKVGSYHDTKKAAVQKAEEIANNRKSKVIKHNKNE